MRTKVIVIGLVITLMSSTFYSVVNASSYDKLTTSEKIGQYHLRINEITNKHFAEMLEYFEENDDIDSLLNESTRQRIAAPASDDLAQKICTEDEDFMNFSTSCLAYKLNQELSLLVASVQVDRDSIPKNTKITDITGGVKTIAVNNDFITEEIERSVELQRQTLAFYRQTMFAYPLHIQYEITLDQLSEFMSELVNFKDSIISYPSQFHDATTAQCV